MTETLTPESTTDRFARTFTEVLHFLGGEISEHPAGGLEMRLSRQLAGRLGTPHRQRFGDWTVIPPRLLADVSTLWKADQPAMETPPACKNCGRSTTHRLGVCAACRALVADRVAEIASRDPITLADCRHCYGPITSADTIAMTDQVKVCGRNVWLCRHCWGSRSVTVDPVLGYTG